MNDTALDVDEAYARRIAAMVEKIMDKPGVVKSNRVSVDAVLLYLEVLHTPEFRPVWSECVVECRSGVDLDTRLLTLCGPGTRIDKHELRAVRLKADQIIGDRKPRGTWPKVWLLSRWPADGCGRRPDRLVSAARPTTLAAHSATSRG